MDKIGPYQPGDRPLYLVLADRVLDAIDRGEYLPGQLLPMQKEFAARHGVCTFTAWRTFDLLRKQGVVYTIPMGPGKGTYVSVPNGPEAAPKTT